MNIHWIKKEELIPTVIKHLKGVDVVLDIGCGIMPQPYITPKVHICCEPFEQYVKILLERQRGKTDRTYVVLNLTWEEVINFFPPNSVDTVFLVDIIEHLKKEEGKRLLNETKKIAGRQIILFTPLGFMPQEHPDGKDAWNLDGGAWQEHKSGWLPEDFDENWTIYACKEYHETDNTGKRSEPPFGAFWAIWNTPEHKEDQVQIFQNAPKSLWLSFQELQQEYQVLQQSKAVVIARKLGGYPLLMKLLSAIFIFLAKAYSCFKRHNSIKEMN